MFSCQPLNTSSIAYFFKDYDIKVVSLFRDIVVHSLNSYILSDFGILDLKNLLEHTAINLSNTS